MYRKPRPPPLPILSTIRRRSFRFSSPAQVVILIDGYRGRHPERSEGSLYFPLPLQLFSLTSHKDRVPHLRAVYRAKVGMNTLNHPLLPLLLPFLIVIP